MRRFYGIIFLVGILTPTLSKAQTMDCEQTIAYATEEFNAGHFYSVPSILNDCLTSFNRDQRQRANLLLTQTYLLLDDPIGAQRSYLEVLAANPEFVPDEQLHAIDIVYLSKRFTATPRFSWLVGAGTNVSPMRVIVDNELMPEDESYALRLGYHFGAGGEYSYNDRIKIRLEANFLQTAYHLQTGGFFGGDTRTFTERQSWINVPLYVCYSDPIGPYRPYGYAGISVSNLFVDNASMTTQRVTMRSSGDDGDGESFTQTSPIIDFLDRRNRINQSLILGGGIKYKIGLDFVFAEIRYSAGLKNIVNPDYIYADPHAGTTSPEYVLSQDPQSYKHVDDYLRLDNIAITIGFIRPLYKPRELKRVRTKSVLRKMNRGK